MASRLVERFHRPVVLIAGSGRLEGIGALDPELRPPRGSRRVLDYLERFGGHRAAAGLSIDPANVPAFAAAFSAYADAVLSEDDLQQMTKVDAVVSAEDLLLDLAQAPIASRRSAGNPDVTLLVPAYQPVGGPDGGRGEAPPLPGAPAGGATRIVRSRSAREGQLDRLRPACSTSPAVEGEPLERD